MDDLRQSPMWGDYLSQINWQVEKLSGNQILIRRLALFNHSLIKMQRPKNPPPFKEIEELAKKHKAFFVLIEPEIKKYNPKDYKIHGFQPTKMALTHTATIQIDLTLHESKLWANLSENAQRNIKKAIKNGIKVRYFSLNQSKSAEIFAEFNALQQSLTQMRKFWQPGTDEMGKKMAAFKKTSGVFLAYEKDNPKPIAGIWVGYFKSRAFYMHVGATQAGYQRLANYLLVWEGIKKAKKLGYKIWDFEGVYNPRYPKDRVKWRGFSEFKSRFHGEFVEYPHPWIKFYNPFFKYFYLCSQIFN